MDIIFLKKKIQSKNKTKYKINKRKIKNSEQVSRESRGERKEFAVSRPTRRNSSELEWQCAHQARLKNLTRGCLKTLKINKSKVKSVCVPFCIHFCCRIEELVQCQSTANKNGMCVLNLFVILVLIRNLYNLSIHNRSGMTSFDFYVSSYLHFFFNIYSEKSFRQKKGSKNRI